MQLETDLQISFAAVVQGKLFYCQGLARTQTPTTKNNAPELPTFGVIAGVNLTEVQ